MAKRRPTRPSAQKPRSATVAPAAVAATPAASPESAASAAGATPPPPPTAETWPRWHRWLGALLFLVVLGVFLPALRNDFVTYDDPAYVIENPHVNRGLTAENVRWAWTSFEHSNWHPLTWMSHQLDCSLFGLAPWGHHLTNLLLHAASALLLFVGLRRATGFLWRSLLVAALFGLHPLRVESVAWIAERKDVLSTLLGLLSLWAYVAYAQRAQARQPRAWLPYAGALVAFAASLTAKPMLVTLPCVLLLLDLWPLGRWTGAGLRARLRLVLEKLPFAALAAVSCVFTVRAQSAGGAVQAMENFTLGARVANALLAYGQYLGKLLWPADLAVLYPNFGEQPPLATILFAAALLLALTGAAVFALRRGRPWALVGWLWFLGTLVPVIGFVQVGGQTMADRYSYVPSIGMLLVLVWLVAELTARLPRRTLALGVTAAAALAACVALTSLQLARWRSSITLFRHTLAVTENNWMAHFNLYLAYSKSASTAREARQEYQEVLKIVAAFADLQNQRGLRYLAAGDLPEAIAYFRKSIRVKGDESAPHANLGRALLQSGQPDEAIAALQTAVGLGPENGEAHLALGRALTRQPERRAEAIAELRLAVWLLSERADAHCALAAALAPDPRRRSEAVAEYESALRLDPANAEATAGLARLRSEN